MNQKEARRKAAKLKAPRPVELPSGAWRCQVMVNGKRISVVDDDPEIAHAKALALKNGLIESEKKAGKITLNDAIVKYMEAGEGVLSPTTIRGYEIMRKHRFQSIMNKDIHELTRLDVQKAVSDEAKEKAPKTVINAYGLLTAVLKDYGISFTGIKLPQKVRKKAQYLSADEVVKLIDGAVGDSCEVPILMAVWLGMRRSEICGLCWDCVDIEAGTVEVRRAMVPDKDNHWVLKEYPKNEGSQRVIKCPSYIMEKLKERNRGQDGRVFDDHPDTIRKHVHAVCKRAGITDTTVHGLRHANAAVMIALGVVDKYAMARNGWTSDYTFKQIYGYVFPEGAKETDDLINSYFEEKLNLHTDLHTEKVEP